MSEKKEIALFTEEQAKKGVEFKINQNDIIDLLVEEKINEITSKVEFFEKRVKTIDKKCTMHFQNFYANALKSEVKEISSKIDDSSIETSNYCYGKDEQIHIFGFLEEKARLVLDKSHYSKTNAIKSLKRATVKFKMNVGSTKIDCSIDCQKPYKISKELVEEINMHNKEVEEFCKVYDGFPITVSAMTRFVKIQFTKNFLKKCPSDFRKMITAGVNLDNPISL